MHFWVSLLDEDKNLKVEIHSVSGDDELKEQMQKAQQIDQEFKEQLAKIGFEIQSSKSKLK